MPNPKVRTLTIGGVTYDLQDNISGYITGITSSDVTTALGFTPYNGATNPNGYTSNTGTITSVKTTAGAHTTINVSSGAANFNVPTKTSHLTNDSGFLTSYTETDPTVPSWAKESSKPSYNFSEIGSTPTTLSGYGITNAYTKTEVDGLVSGVLHYKGTKANYAALPSSGNTTGDVWHLTDTGAEWAWDGNVWQELGTAVDLSNYVTTDDSRLSDARTPTAHNQALSTITDADDLKAIEALTGTSGLLKKTAANTWTLDTNTYLTSYTETDPVFSASAAAGITSTDISNWNAKPSTDEKVAQIPITSSFNAEKSLVLGNTLATLGGNTTTNSVITSPYLTYKYPSNYLYIKQSNGKSLAIYPLGLEWYDGTNKSYLTASSVTSGHSWSLPDKTGTIALTSDMPTKVSDLTNDSGFITSYTDEKVKSIVPTGGGTFYIVGSASSSTETAPVQKHAAVSMFVTTDEISGGDARIILGNNLTNVAGAKRGLIRLYGNGTSYTDITSYVTSSTQNISFPNASGTVALTSDIPSIYNSSTNPNGYLTMSTLPIYDGTVE